MQNDVTLSTIRPINEIAADIRRTWINMYPGARPYVERLRHVKTVADIYDKQRADYIIRGFLANAIWFKGEAARRLKWELHGHLDMLTRFHR